MIRLVLLLALVAAAGCTDPFEGCYARTPVLPTELRVSKQPQGYSVVVHEGNGWSPALSLRRATSQELGMFHMDPAKTEGLVNPTTALGIFHRTGENISGAPYLVTFLFGTQPAFKVRCG